MLCWKCWFLVENEQKETVQVFQLERFWFGTGDRIRTNDTPGMNFRKLPAWQLSTIIHQRPARGLCNICGRAFSLFYGCVWAPLSNNRAFLSKNGVKWSNFRVSSRKTRAKWSKKWAQPSKNDVRLGCFSFYRQWKCFYIHLNRAKVKHYFRILVLFIGQILLHNMAIGWGKRKQIKTEPHNERNYYERSWNEGYC